MYIQVEMAAEGREREGDFVGVSSLGIQEDKEGRGSGKAEREDVINGASSSKNTHQDFSPN